MQAVKKVIIADKDLEMIYLRKERFVPFITVFVWNKVHNPANEISDIISEGINQSGKVAATEAHNKKELMPLVTSKTDPNTAHLMFDKFNVYRNILLIIVKSIIYPPIFVCISKEDNTHLSKSSGKDHFFWEYSFEKWDEVLVLPEFFILQCAFEVNR